MLDKEILLSTWEQGTAAAIIEDGRLMEFYWEKKGDRPLVGGIYLGMVQNVLPGMAAAFCDLGIERNAFLYVEDAVPLAAVSLEVSTGARKKRIEEILQVGQEIMVQIVKQPMEQKGARVTTHITLPGRFLVLVPGADFIGVSRRISAAAERDRLKSVAQGVRHEGDGLIIRTAAQGADEHEIQSDVQYLYSLWDAIRKKAVAAEAPCLIHSDIPLLERVIRDYFFVDVRRLLVDSTGTFQSVLSQLGPERDTLKDRVIISPAEPMSGYQVAPQVLQALRRKVWLKSGGYLLVDRPEALTAVDVNSGKYVGQKSLASTVLRINLEAAVEIPRQLRLRNIGGLVLIDFIDMDSEKDRQLVLSTLESELQKDRTTTHLAGITPLGMVEMTRKKVYPELGGLLEEECPHCQGRGRLLSPEAETLPLLRDVEAGMHQS